MVFCGTIRPSARCSFGLNTTQWVAESTKTAGLLDHGWRYTGRDRWKRTRMRPEKLPMMPEYGLGFWQCKLRYYNQEELLEVAKRISKAWYSAGRDS